MFRKTTIIKTSFILVFFCLFFTGNGFTQEIMGWDNIVKNSRGQTVDWYMWGGSPAVNAYVNGFLATALKKQYDITLRQVPVKDIAEVVNKLVVEKQAGKGDNGGVDLMWINGENFRTCKQKQLLYGPFTNNLPNIRLVDSGNPTINNDFGTPVENMESPWGSAQIVMIYDSIRTPNPPKSIRTLVGWIKAHPGRFTYPAPPNFTGSAFLRHIFYEVAGDVDKWQGHYTKQELAKAANKTYALLNDIKNYLWRGGSTYPESPLKMNTLFADHEIDFSFSYQQGAASRNILEGLFPNTVRTFVFDRGTIANTHFVAIPANARDKAGAMVVANFLLSPAAQLEKAKPDVWGDFPVISPAKLSTEWQQKFSAVPKGPATLTDAELQNHQLPELPSNILIYLEKGWEKHVLKGQ